MPRHALGLGLNSQKQISGGKRVIEFLKKINAVPKISFY